MLEAITISPKQLADALRYAYEMRRNVFIHSAPGVGKTSIVGQVADDMGIELIAKRAAETESVDWSGLPTITDDRTTWTQPEFIPTEGAGILFADEINRGAQSVQNAIFRRAERGELPPDWIMVCAGNRASDGCMVGRMDKALANRFIHYTVEPNALDWRDYALRNDFDASVIAHIDINPAALSCPTTDPNALAYASPRSWHFVSDALQAGCNNGLLAATVAGCVGPEQGAEFMGFRRVWESIQHPDAILMDPQGATVPDDSSAIIATCHALATRASKDNFESVVTYCRRLPGEFQAMLVKTCTARKPQLQATKPFIQWAADNADILI